MRCPNCFADYQPNEEGLLVSCWACGENYVNNNETEATLVKIIRCPTCNNNQFFITETTQVIHKVINWDNENTPITQPLGTLRTKIEGPFCVNCKKQLLL